MMEIVISSLLTRRDFLRGHQIKVGDRLTMGRSYRHFGRKPEGRVQYRTRRAYNDARNPTHSYKTEEKSY